MARSSGFCMKWGRDVQVVPMERTGVKVVAYEVRVMSNEQAVISNQPNELPRWLRDKCSSTKKNASTAEYHNSSLILITFFMTLRTKLLAGYLIFVAALVVLGGLSAWRLREMGGVARRIISNNYDSVVAAQEMKESLERQDSAALFLLLGARDKAATQLREHRERFDASFKKAAANITEAGEHDAIEAIRRDRDSYYQMPDSFMVRVELSTAPRPTLEIPSWQPATSTSPGLEPQFNKLRSECEHLLQLNQRAMVGKSKQPRECSALVLPHIGNCRS